MSEATSISSLKAVFRFPFQGPNWRDRFLVGAALTFAASIVPIVPLIFVQGYALQIMRQAIKSQSLTLPPWDNWSQFGKDGLRQLAVRLVYLLPGILMFSAGAIIWLMTILGTSLATGGSTTSEGGKMLPGILLGGWTVMIALVSLGSMLSLLGNIPIPVATSHMIAQDKLASAFHVREWWRLLRANWPSYLVCWAVLLGVSGVSGLVLMCIYGTVVLCCALPFLMAPLMFFTSLLSAALFGQAYQESVALLEAIPKVTLDN